MRVFFTLLYFTDHLNSFFFSQKLMVRLTYGSGSALFFIAIKILSLFLINELYTVSQYFSETFASYGPVRLVYEKKT